MRGWFVHLKRDGQWIYGFETSSAVVIALDPRLLSEWFSEQAIRYNLPLLPPGPVQIDRFELQS